MWFRKQRNHPEVSSGFSAKQAAFKDQAASWIADRIISVQMRLARKLSTLEKNCNQMQKKIALILFCGIVSCYLFFNLRDVLTEKPMQLKGADQGPGTMSIPPVLPALPLHNKADTVVKPSLP